VQSTDIQKMLADVRGFLLDMDGTVYLGDRLIEGADVFLRRVAQSGRSAQFLTNNSSRNAAHYQQKLARMGIEVRREQILTSGQAAADVIKRLYPGARVWVLGNDYLKEELAEHGVTVVDSRPDVVLAGYDNTLTYRKLCEFCDYVRAGLPYIATHPDFNCPVDGGFEPDLGSMMALVEASTGRKADRIAGKPEEDLVLLAQRRGGHARERLCMCGDRLYTDIAFGKRHGMLTVLVLTGEAKREDIAAAQHPPDIVVEGLGALARYL
jgi:HAD superfamily hydrolase (TIGR01450 family)